MQQTQKNRHIVTYTRCNPSRVNGTVEPEASVDELITIGTPSAACIPRLYAAGGYQQDDGGYAPYDILSQSQQIQFFKHMDACHTYDSKQFLGVLYSCIGAEEEHEEKSEGDDAAGTSND